LNRGNWALPVGGRVSVIDKSGRVRFRARVASPDVILPKAVVDLPARLAKPVLEPGVYTLRGAWRANRYRFRTSGTMRLFGPNTVATRGAQLLELDPGDAWIGEPLELKVPFRNTGNVKFAPRVEAVVRPLGNRGAGKAYSQLNGQPEPVAAGETGSVKLQLDTPPGKQAYQVDVRVYDGKRLFDAASTSLTPTEKPGLVTRIGNWIKDHAVLLVSLLVLLLLLAVAYAVWRSRRPRAPVAVRVAEPEPAPPPLAPVAAVAPAPPPPAPVVASPNGRVNINRAGVEELVGLPGVGRLAASRLVEYREAHGPFASLDDLRAVEGFHSERIQRLAGLAEL
jgi:competence ComEA-like helix-hairpin-helix protein